MTVSQIGVFRHGMFGFPVEITLSSGPIPLASVTQIHLAVKRPSESTPGISRNLTLPDAVLDAANGVIAWQILDGEIPVVGVYNFTLTINYGTNERLIVDAMMKVS
jgi:hypothetical protein